MAKQLPTLKVYHNTRCSKSRGVCEILEEKKVKTEIIEYLKTPPSQKEIKGLLKMLGMKASELVRKNEPVFKEKFADKKLTEAQWIKALAENPILIERPIIVKGDKALIGRPPEKVLEFLK
jgi:arsenate reductase (glutaredoxin)